jgi:hypothetical protein
MYLSLSKMIVMAHRAVFDARVREKSALALCDNHLNRVATSYYTSVAQKAKRV